ncbi:c-type cytochrome [Aquabacter spiritensis]|uniref:Cytochrome c n=1 Tax=Aquabacter spiritensis TaxID=933073 RepID=A0A4R3LQA3_9HYPH|nr:c-type cytochrome [Aquabacter spiritensis]TCT02602.1 cytochrome c [Aquabacter spiritensis]
MAPSRARPILAVATLGLALLSPPLHAAEPDIAKGEQAFRKCLPCHAVGPGAKAKVGPPLNGIVGARWAAFPGFTYSQDLRDGGAAGRTWDAATLDAYLANPKVVAPGGRMAFFGIKGEAERANLIAYLKGFSASGATGAEDGK